VTGLGRPARIKRQWLALSAAALMAPAVLFSGGCSVGGQGTDTGGRPAELAVTRDFGGSSLGSAEFLRLPAGPTVMRLLQGEFDTQTSYGGRFVTAIEGLESAKNPARDWIYYVNGEEADVGAAELRVRPGDRVQWDYHRWDGMTIGRQIVGAFPQPFSARGARIVCARDGDPNCREAEQRLRTAGVRIVKSAGVPIGVGLPSGLAKRQELPSLTRPGGQSGLMIRARGDRIELLDDTATPRGSVPPRGGVVVAADGDDGPAWFVTGRDDAGVAAALNLLTRNELADQFGRWVDGAGEPHMLPWRGGL
jgi:hypothetical protein